MTRWLRILLGGCPHREMVRDRLTTDDGGVEDVPHFVCLDCGHAEPIIRRTPDEHRQAQRAGAIVPLRAVPVPPDPQAGVIRLRERKRA